MDRRKFANEIADKWGPSLTKAFNEGDISAFRDFFVTHKPTWVVLQDGKGEEAEFTVGDSVTEEGGAEEGVTMTWDDFRETMCKDLAAQNYSKTEAQCLGILGDRILLEVGRFNKDGVVYVEAYSLLTISEDGKVAAVETFSDPQAASLMNLATGTAEIAL